MPSKCLTVSCMILCGLSLIRCFYSSIENIKTIDRNREKKYDPDYPEFKTVGLIDDIEEARQADTISNILLYIEAISSVHGIVIYGVCLYTLIKKKENIKNMNDIIMVVTFIFLKFIILNAFSIALLRLTGVSVWLAIAPITIILYFCQIPFELFKIYLFLKWGKQIVNENGIQLNSSDKPETPKLNYVLY